MIRSPLNANLFFDTPLKKGSENFQWLEDARYKWSMQLSGKRALVTGGALRIGRAIVLALQSCGAEVVVHYRNSAEEARKLSPFSVQADLSDPEQCAGLIQQAGPLDILVNNASIFTKDTLSAATPDRVLQEFQVNLFAPMVLTRAFAVQAGQGAVINLLDRRIRCHDTSCVPYSITKKGLEELTRLSALEFAPGIRVNGVAPGPVLPPPDSPSISLSEISGRVPLETMPSPEQIADAALFLLQADAVTGQVIYVDGGQHLLGNGV